MASDSGYFLIRQDGTGAQDDPYRPMYLYDNSATPPGLRSEIETFYGSEEIDFDSYTVYATKVFVADGYDPVTVLGQLDSQTYAVQIEPADVQTALNSANILPVDITAKEWAITLSKFLQL